MNLRFVRYSCAALCSLALAVSSAAAQPPERDRPDGGRPPRGERDGDRPRRGPGDRQGGPEVAPDAMAKQMIERFDKDGDKKLDSTELVAALTEMRNLRGRRGGGRPEGGRPEGGRPEGGRPDGERGPREGFNPEAMLQRIFEQNDKDDDGKLSGDEIPERMQRNLDRIDTNDDGAVDKKEAEAMFSQMRDRRPGGDRPRDGGGRRRGEGDGARPEGDRPRRPPAE
ncbi:EF-hand domain-containing protein [Roseimaritima ulvae]|uniref:EF hand n=1 Tax=Roseimaritima ulvae TaxID=980254 RepID=A0A5B9QZ53_9BACT|nr:hypothetical protein [Roseimaritima ulvae]QEG43342.1 EF hand [Roseimaritima ulvae]